MKFGSEKPNRSERKCEKMEKLTVEKTLQGIVDLIQDRESFVRNDTEMTDIFLYDIAVLESAVRLVELSQKAVKWIQAYTESIDQPCIACKYYQGKNESIAELQRKKRICSACNGRMGTESCRWEFGG